MARVLIYLDTEAGHKHAEEIEPDECVEISNVVLEGSFSKGDAKSTEFTGSQ